MKFVQVHEYGEYEKIQKGLIFVVFHFEVPQAGVALGGAQAPERARKVLFLLPFLVESPEPRFLMKINISLLGRPLTGRVSLDSSFCLSWARP